MLVKLLLLLALIARCSGLEDNLFINSALAIKNHFRSGCVYFVSFNDDDVKQTLKFLSWMKRFWREEKPLGVIKSSWTYNSLKELQCERNTRLIIVNGNEENSRNFLLRISKNVYICDAIWVLYLEYNTSLEEFFTDINIPFDCEFLVVQQESHHVLLTEVYRISPKLPLETYPFGHWIPSEGLTWPALSYYKRRHSLQGYRMRTGIPKDLFQEFEHLPDGSQRQTGLFGELWNMLEVGLNFTTEYHIPTDDNGGGDRLPNGNWTGVFGMLQREEVDVSNAPFSMIPKRMDVVKYTRPIMDIKTYLVIKKPNAYELKWEIFVMPFTRKLWIAILVTIILLASIFKVIYFSRRYEISNQRGITYIEAFLNVLSAFCQQGQTNIPKTSSLRLAYGTLYLMAFLTMACYSASFITHLTLRKTDLPFCNFEEFLEHGKYKLHLLQKSAQMDYFKKAKVKVLQEIYKKMIAPYERKDFISEKEDLKGLCNVEKYAYMISTTSMMKKDYLPKCNLAIIPQAFYPGSQAFVTTKKSPYLGIINSKLQMFSHDKRVKDLYKKYAFKLPVNEEDISMAVNLYDATPILVVLGTGLIISIIMYVLEMFCKS